MGKRRAKSLNGEAAFLTLRLQTQLEGVFSAQDNLD